MKRYLYCALLAPSLMMAQEVPSLFSLAKRSVAASEKFNLGTLTQECREAVKSQRLVWQLEAHFTTYWEKKEDRSKWFLEKPEDKLFTPTEIADKTRQDIQLAMRNKENDRHTGFDLSDTEGKVFKTILADGTFLFIIEVGTEKFDNLINSKTLSKQVLATALSTKDANLLVPDGGFSGFILEEIPEKQASYSWVNFDQKIERINTVDLLTHQLFINENITD